MSQFDTPILLVVFNRPDTTQRIIEVLRQLQPKYLYIAADGPRINKKDEVFKCEEVRKEVLEGISWDCEVKTLFREENLGCRIAVSSAITWFFENVEEGIILEDDTLPHVSFFRYCQIMLERYRDEDNVMHIAGVNFQEGIKRGKASYYFSKYPHIWGWGTWKRAWKKYNLNISEWPQFKTSNQFKDWCFSKKEMDFWSVILDTTYNNEINTWDYQWVFTIIKNNGLCIMPNCNLVSNIGFREDATHTNQFNPQFAEKPVFEYEFTDTYVSNIISDKDADLFTFNNVFNNVESSKQQGVFSQKGLTPLINTVKSKFLSFFKK